MKGRKFGVWESVRRYWSLFFASATGHMRLMDEEVSGKALAWTPRGDFDRGAAVVSWSRAPMAPSS